MQQLTGQQRGRLSEALQAAFPTVDDLQLMLQFQLELRLVQITSLLKPYPHIVFDLIADAEARGYTERLIRAALEARPNNPELLAFARLVGIIQRFLIELHEITQALHCQAPGLPSEEIDQIAEVIVLGMQSLLHNNSTHPVASTALPQQPGIMVSPRASEALAGQEVHIPGKATISFGEGSQIGDIQFRDVAQGNIFHIHFHIATRDGRETQGGSP
jgi:hypothetical protein